MAQPDTLVVDPPIARYDAVQRALHWSMAAIILVAVALGFWSSFLVPGTPLRKFLLEIHNSLGMTALMLVAIRIVYRLMVPAPSYREPLARLVDLGSKAAHLALYLLMVGMPLTGYLFSGAGGYSLPWFGLFHWPRLVPLDKPMAQFGQALHGWGAIAIYIVLALHLTAVVWHQFVKKDDVLARMLPANSRR